jgi:hypothetical protein
MRHERIHIQPCSPGQSGFKPLVTERSSSAGFPAAARATGKSLLYTPVGFPKWVYFSNDDVCELRGQRSWQGGGGGGGLESLVGLEGAGLSILHASIVDGSCNNFFFFKGKGAVRIFSCVA